MRRVMILSFLCFALITVTQPSIAQDRPQDLEPLPELAPSPEEQGGTADEPAVTIKQRGEDKVEEYRVNGRLYMIKVTPKRGKPYYLVDRKGDGKYLRLDSLDSGFTVPQWVIIDF